MKAHDVREQLPALGASDGAAVGRGVHSVTMRGGMFDATLRAPFPWFGGKSRVAHLVWPRFGDVPNYVEPFAGSLAVLLARPHEPRIETVNDADAYLANLWRATREAPALVAAEADRPVNEADLHAIHRWLVYGPTEEAQHRAAIVRALEALATGDPVAAEEALRAALAEGRPRGPVFRERMRRDPEYFDPEIAGRWVWGLCAWIGSGWCTTNDATFHENEGKRPEIGAGGEGAGRPRHGKGVHAKAMRDLPQKRPILAANHGTQGDYPYHGQGVHALGMRARVDRDENARPDLSAAGRGVHAPGQRAPHQKLPRVGAGGGDSGAEYGVGVHGRSTRSALYETFERLAARLRYVRVACGDWSRICTDSVTWRHGTTAMFLDPPYSDDVRAKGLYAVDSGEVAAEVLRWCREHGADERLRVALCGYDNEAHGDALVEAGWSVVAWKANGGYGGQRRDKSNDNAARERIWFSPGCLAPATPRVAQQDLALDLGGAR